jgi:hypothetical protein
MNIFFIGFSPPPGIAAAAEDLPRLFYAIIPVWEGIAYKYA